MFIGMEILYQWRFGEDHRTIAGGFSSGEDYQRVTSSNRELYEFR